MKYQLAPGWTKEKILDHIYKYNNGTVAAQSDEEGVTNACRYETSDGNRCFIGCFIPDAIREARWSDGPVVHLLNEFPALWNVMPFESDRALQDFQQLHDIYFQEADVVPEDIREVVKPWLDEFVEDPNETSVVL
jgi:hypothetical protein